MQSRTRHATAIPGASRIAWLHPTRRAIDWTSLSLVTVALVGTQVLLAGRDGDVPDLIHYLAVGAVAAGTVLGLDDPAQPLLEAAPTSFPTRLVHRLIVLTGGVTLVVAVLAGTERLLGIRPAAGPGLAATLIALVAFGVAVHAISTPVIEHASEAAAAATLFWVIAALVVPPELVPQVVGRAWLDHPWPVAALATAATVAVTIGDKPLSRRKGPA